MARQSTTNRFSNAGKALVKSSSSAVTDTTKENVENTVPAVEESVHTETVETPVSKKTSDKKQSSRKTAEKKKTDPVEKMATQKPDINELFKMQGKQTASSHTFYITDESYKKLNDTAKTYKMSISKVLETLINQYL